MHAQLAAAAAGGADMAECRLDYLTPLPERAALIAFFATSPLPLIVTFRPVRQGGRYAGDEDARLALLAELAPLAAAVDVEDDVPADRWPGAPMVILSHHDFERCPDDLAGLATSMSQQPCDVVKIAFTAAGPEQAVAALDVVRQCPKPAIILAMGEAGLISRVLARKVGAFGTFAAVDAQSGSAPGQPTLEQMKQLYRWDAINSATWVFGVVGCPISHSLSPAIHNAALAAMGVDGVYLPVRVEPGYEPFERFMKAVTEQVWLDWRGLSVTLPHKESALRYLGRERCEQLSARIGAVNTISLRIDGSLHGENTDYAAALVTLCDGLGIEPEQLSRQRAAVLGAGGVARAVVAGLLYAGARVTIYNRNNERAEELAGEFGCAHQPWQQRHRLSDAIVINCTSIGMAPQAEQSPLDRIPVGIKVVFDTIYTPLRTRLLDLAAAAGAKTISGLEMFINQAARQFQAWTGKEAPRDLMRSVATEALAGPAPQQEPEV